MAKRKKTQRKQITEFVEKEPMPTVLPGTSMRAALTAKEVQAKREKLVKAPVNPVAQRAMMPEARKAIEKIEEIEANTLATDTEIDCVELNSTPQESVDKLDTLETIDTPESQVDDKNREKASLLKRILSWREEAMSGRQQVAAASAEAVAPEAHIQESNAYPMEVEEPTLEFDLDEPEYGLNFEHEDLTQIDVDKVLQEKISEVTAFAEELHLEHEEVKRQEGILKFKRSEKERKLTLKQIATILQVEQSTIRFWEKEFAEYLGQSEIKGQRKWYDQSQLEMLTTIRELLQTEQYTIKGAKRRLELDNLLAASLGIEPSFKSTVFVMFAAIMQELGKYRDESQVLAQKVAALEDEKEVIEEKLQEEQNRGFMEFLRQKIHNRKVSTI